MWLITQKEKKKKRPEGTDKLETVPQFLIIKRTTSKLPRASSDNAGIGSVYAGACVYSAMSLYTCRWRRADTLPSRSHISDFFFFSFFRKVNLFCSGVDGRFKKTWDSPCDLHTYNSLYVMYSFSSVFYSPLVLFFPQYVHESLCSVLTSFSFQGDIFLEHLKKKKK